MIPYCTTLLFFVLFWGKCLAAVEVVYVSPRGSDAGKGTADEPFYSLNRAVDGRLTASPDTLFVMVAAGDYYMDRPFSLTTPSSRPVVICSEGKEKPRFLGGIPVKGWQKCGEGLYRAYVPEVVRYGFNFEQFYVNGRRAVLARTPNEDWYEVSGSGEKAMVQGVRTADYAVQRIEFETADWKSLWGLSERELSHLKFRFYHKWDITHKTAEYIHVDSGYVYFSGVGMKPWNPIRKGSRYIMYDYKAGLDAPGEWYLDREAGYLYYMPREDEDMETAGCIAPALRQWVVVKGQPGQPVSRVTFRNLSFQYSSYVLPQGGENPVQAAANAEAAVLLDFAEHISWVDCELLHTGTYALWLRQECMNNTVEHCYIADLGAGGIKVGEPYFRRNDRPVSQKNVIRNNIIAHAGYELPCGVGVGLFLTAGNRVEHNDIGDLRYSGVSVGWVWGYNHSKAVWTTLLDSLGRVCDLNGELINPAVGNRVEYNHIHHIGWGELSDMGAVYTLGESPGTKVSHNVIHDVLSYDYGGWGLYTDEGSTGVEMSYNLVYRCKSGGFHQHYGKENRIENNIFAFGYYYQAQYTRVEPHLSFHFRHNIILQERGRTLAGPWAKGKLDMDYNLYWHTTGVPSFDGYDAADWKKQKETHALIADPLFRNAAGDDFTFASLRNVRKIKFRPWDYSQAGVFGSPEWVEKARLAPEILREFNQAAASRLKK